MSVRSIIRKPATNNQLYNPFEFPKDKDGIVYVRQSSLVQVHTNIHSYEMQTDKFIEHFRNMGCTGRIDIIADDEGMSGTLDMHERPGMSRLMKLIEQEVIGWVGAVHVNRFFRDQWMINPDIFMKECFLHNIIVATLRMTFNFKDPYCQRVFRIEAEEAARHLEWMKVVLGGGKSTASDNGYYDGRQLAPGYIVDRTDPKRKKYIIYKPHADMVFWLFKRFFELDGNFPKLCQEVEQLPYLFPKFESWVDKKNISRFGVKEITDGLYAGYYKPTDQGIRRMLCNPVYIGWWIPLDGGVIKGNHEPIVDEALFTYAHKKLSAYTLSGERQKPERVIRNGKVEAILKKVIEDEKGNKIYTVPDGGGTYRSFEFKGMSLVPMFSVLVKEIDTAFLEKFFERLHNLPEKCNDWKDTIEKHQKAKEDRDHLIRKAIRNAQLKMQRINELMTDIENPLPTSMKQDLLKQYAGLEAKKEELESELTRTPDEEDEEILFQIYTLIPTLIAQWEYLPFEGRLRIVSTLVKKVILSHPAPGWLRMAILWKIADWGVDVAHLRRVSNKSIWSNEEDKIIREMYATEDALDLLKALPDRTWKSIGARAAILGIERGRWKNSTAVNRTYATMCLQDMEYAEKQHIPSTVKNTPWWSSHL